MTKFGRPVQREGQLSGHGLLGPQRAVVVEHRDALRLRYEFGRARIGHGGHELPMNSPIAARAGVSRQLGS
jgi:hypothetical protein